MYDFGWINDMFDFICMGPAELPAARIKLVFKNEKVLPIVGFESSSLR